MADYPEWMVKYNNLPFEEKGRSFNGVDCWGIVNLIYKNELGIVTPDYMKEAPDVADREVVPRAMRDGLMSEWKRRDGEPEVFDLVCFNIAGRLMHCGVMVTKRHFIHACVELPTAIGRIDSHMWRNRIEGYYFHV